MTIQPAPVKLKTRPFFTSMHAKIREHFSKGVFSAPCTPDDIKTVELSLGVSLPENLRALYRAYNGFRGPGNAQYLFPLLSCIDGGSSLLEMSLFFRNWQSPNLSRFIFFGSSTADENWGLHLDGPNKIIAYHHHMENEYEVIGTNIYEVYLKDEKRYDCIASKKGHT